MADPKEPMRLSLVRKERVVFLEKADGTEEKIFIREMEGLTRDEYMTFMGKKLKYDKAGKPVGLNSFNGIHIALLKRCLYDEAGELIKQSVIEKYPEGTVTALFHAAQEISTLEEAQAVELGNV